MTDNALFDITAKAKTRFVPIWSVACAVDLIYVRCRTIHVVN